MNHLTFTESVVGRQFTCREPKEGSQPFNLVWTRRMALIHVYKYSKALTSNIKLIIKILLFVLGKLAISLSSAQLKLSLVL